MKNKVRGFTLVELLAVIVILAIILVIAVPKITDTIKNSKIASFESSAKTIAAQAEKKLMENQVLESTNPINCNNLVELSNSDCITCNIYFDANNNALVTLYGSGKFEGLQIINGTKESAKAEEIKAPVYGNAVNYVNGLYAYDASSNGLERDTTSDNNIRYVGAEPNNYVSFNDEAWRIIGVFGSNLKLIRNDFIRDLDNNLVNYSFDNSTTESRYGTNDWSKSYIRKFLNDFYFDGKNITCNSNVVGELATDEAIKCPDIKKVNSNAKSMVEYSIWNLGAITWKNNTQPSTTYSVNELYIKERGKEIYGDHEIVSRDYIGLVYTSDYGYTSTNSECRNNLKSGTTYTNNTYDFTSAKCKIDNWMYTQDDTWWWGITPYRNSNEIAFGIGYGASNSSYASVRHKVRPVLYLKSNIEIISGSGTSSDPYILK